jgi:capsular exopolysaccharide synthesis family protein
MASMFEKVVTQAKRADAGGPSIDKARYSRKSRREDRDAAASSGLFRMLSFASTEPAVMEKNKILPAVEDKIATTAYKVLRTRVLQSLRSHRWRNLIVTSANQGEGKTVTACNLAISISKDVNQSVILVDLDLQRSSVAKYFGLQVDQGIGDYLMGKAEISDIVYSPEGLDRIAIIPNAKPIDGSSELLASPRMRDLMKWLKEQGGAPLAIFDMPPILACDDVLMFYPSVDAMLMVAAEGITDRGNLTKAIDLLTDCNLLGVVLNKSKEHQKPSNYY